MSAREALYVCGRCGAPVYEQTSCPGCALGDALRVARLGDAIGYGNLMHLAEKIWDQKVPGGGAHSVGPCTAFLVRCPCDDAVQCEWCCGSGRVTKRVAQAVLEARS